MKSFKDEWMEEAGETLLRKIGIKEGQHILDFGCGAGNYALPAARIVGKNGLVYALDKNSNVLNDLMNKANSTGMNNIVRLDASQDSRIPLEDECVDVVFLFDVFHGYYFPEKKRRKGLLRDIHRILKTNAILLLCPTHLESYMEPKLGTVRKEIGEANLDFECEYSGTLLIHDRSPEESQVICFRKKTDFQSCIIHLLADYIQSLLQLRQYI